MTAAQRDRDWLIQMVEKATTDALAEIDPRGYGPRIWLGYRRKKRIAEALRHMKAEARLIGATSIDW